MWRGEGGQRPAFAFRDEHAILRANGDPVLVGDASELVLLGVATGVAPGDSRQQRRGEPFQAGLVLVRDGLLVSAGDRFHAEQVRAAIAGEAQASREDAHRQSGERHLEPRAVGLHSARSRRERRGGPANLLGIARCAVDSTDAAARAGRAASPVDTRGWRRRRHHERRIPEGVPLVLLDHLRRDLDPEVFERLSLLRRHAPHAADDVVLRRQVLTQRGPCACRFPDRQLSNHGLAGIDCVSRAQLGSVLAFPRHREPVSLRNRCETRHRLVLREVTVHGWRDRGGRCGRAAREKTGNGCGDDDQSSPDTKSSETSRPHGVLQSTERPFTTHSWTSPPSRHALILRRRLVRASGSASALAARRCDSMGRPASVAA